MTDDRFNATATELGLQLGASFVLVVLMIAIHSIGLIEVSRRLHLKREELEQRSFDYSAVLLMAGLGSLLVTLHMIEIVIFALFFLAVGALSTLESALYYSAASYSTLGAAMPYFGQEWRLVGGIEALMGFILIGWSTAFMVSTVNRLRG